MDTPSQLTLESTLRSAALVLLSELGGWYAKKYGVELSPAITSLLQHDMVPFVIPALALSLSSWWSHRKTKEASIKIDTGAVLAGISNSDLNAIAGLAQQLKADPAVSVNTNADAIKLAIQRALSAQAAMPQATIKEAVAVVSSNKGVI